MIEKEYYEVDGDSYVQEILSDDRQITRLRAVVNLIPPDIKTLVDLGCGSGVFLKLLREQKPEIKSSGLERSKSLIVSAQKLLGTPIFEGSLNLLPFEDKSFQIVTAMEVIEHIPQSQYKQSLTEIERIAQESIIISVPYKEVREFVSCPACSCKFSSSYHMREYNDYSLSVLFNDYQLVKLEIIKLRMPIFGKFFRFANNTLNTNEFNKYCICPACGYKKNDVQQQVDESLDSVIEPKIFTPLAMLKSKIKQVYPRVEQPVWAVGIYERKPK